MLFGELFMYEFLFLLFGLDEKIENRKEGRERKREREKIYHIITMMMKMMFCFTRNIRQGKAQDSEKKCADGASLIFLFSIKDT